MASERPKRGDKGTPKQTQESGNIPQPFDPTENVRPLRKNIAGNQIVVIPGTGIYEIEDRKTPADDKRKKDDSKIFLDIQKNLKKEFKKSQKREKQTHKILKETSRSVETGAKASKKESKSKDADTKPKKGTTSKDIDKEFAEGSKGFFKKTKEVIIGKDAEGKEAKAKTKTGAFGMSLVSGARESIGKMVEPLLDLPVVSQFKDAVIASIDHGREQKQKDKIRKKEELQENREKQQDIQEQLNSIESAAKQFQITYEEMTPGGAKTSTKTVEAENRAEAIAAARTSGIFPTDVEPIKPENQGQDSLKEQLSALEELEKDLEHGLGIRSPGYLHDILIIQKGIKDHNKKILSLDADRKLTAKENKNESRKTRLFAKKDKDNEKRNEEGGGGFFSNIFGMVTSVVSIAALLKKPKLLFKHLLKKIPGAKVLSSIWSKVFKGGSWLKSLGGTIWKGISGLGSTLSKGLSGLGSLLSKGTSKVAAAITKTVAGTGGAAVADAVSSSPGFLSRMWSKTKSVAGAAVGGVVKGAKAVGGAVTTGAKAVGGVVSSGAKAVWKGAKIVGGVVKKGGKWVATKAGDLVLGPIKKALKSGGVKWFGKLIKGIPILTTLLEAIFAHQDIKEIIANPDMTRGEKEQAVGRRASGMIGAIIGTALGSIAGTAIPIPIVGTAVGAIGGSLVGEWLGGMVADLFGAKPIGKVLMDNVYDKMPNKDDVLNAPAGGGGGGGSQFGGVRVSPSGQGAKLPRRGLVAYMGTSRPADFGEHAKMLSSTSTSKTSGGVLTTTNEGLHNNQSLALGTLATSIAVNSPTSNTNNSTTNNTIKGKGDSRMDESAFNQERIDANRANMF